MFVEHLLCAGQEQDPSPPWKVWALLHLEAGVAFSIFTDGEPEAQRG